MTREQAIQHAQKLGEHTTTLTGEIREEAQQRINRAKAYAAWEHDGKPIGNWDKYKKEFNLTGTNPEPSMWRDHPHLRNNKQ